MMHAELSFAAPYASPAARKNKLAPCRFLILNDIIQIVVTSHEGLTMAVVIIADAFYKIWFSFFFTRFFFNHFCQLLLNDYLFLLVCFIVLLNYDLFFSLFGNFLLLFFDYNDFGLSVTHRHPLFLRRFWLSAMVMGRCSVLYYALSRLMRGARRKMRALRVVSDYNDTAISITTFRRAPLRWVR